MRACDWVGCLLYGSQEAERVWGRRYNTAPKDWLPGVLALRTFPPLLFPLHPLSPHTMNQNQRTNLWRRSEPWWSDPIPEATPLGTGCHGNQAFGGHFSSKPRKSPSTDSRSRNVRLILTLESQKGTQLPQRSSKPSWKVTEERTCTTLIKTNRPCGRSQDTRFQSDSKNEFRSSTV